ncbi:unnamed protein product [Larinioides sclopetarius]|uniref:Methionine adenosyltransferase 2 subunit beta n=1 Tax=Larinioides sclopetarius TaxID=280406 RepID=A0AAV1YU71_9ARAC
MNVIVTGASGLLGRAVVAEFKRNSWKVLGLARTRVRDDLVQIELADINAVSRIVREFKPHAIVHCAAERSPDKIQENPSRYEKLNVAVPRELAKLADEVKAVFVFISTDYVFSGENPPYREDDMVDPLNAYGVSKVKAEQAVIMNNSDSCILRIPVLYGGEESIEESAVSVLINSIKMNVQVQVSNLEIRFPSHTKDVAGIIYELVQRKLQDKSLKSNIYQWCGSEPFTKYEMACIIAETFGQDHDHLVPVNVASPGTPRPMNCQMSCERLENLGIRRNTRFVDGIEDFRKFFE